LQPSRPPPSRASNSWGSSTSCSTHSVRPISSRERPLGRCSGDPSALPARPAADRTRNPRPGLQPMIEPNTATPPLERAPRAAYVLDPAGLPDHIDALYRAAWAMCGSPLDAEDLVQTTFEHVLKRPRIIRNDNERAYLLRALRNTHASHYRSRSRRPATVTLIEDDAPPSAEPATVSSPQIMQAVAATPPLFRGRGDRRGCPWPLIP
jgi:hypothetical protein